MEIKNIFQIIFSLLLVACCGAVAPPDNQSPFTDILFRADVQNGLSNSERLNYYYYDEGIQYLPFHVITSLKRPKEDGIGLYNELFFDNPERLGMYKNFLNADFPPVGLTISDKNEKYVRMAGINCATCHTAFISKDGQGFYVDGAPSTFAINRLIRDMMFSMISTSICPSEFNEFYDRYILASKSKLPQEDAVNFETEAFYEYLDSAENCQSVQVSKDLYIKVSRLEGELKTSLEYNSIRVDTTLNNSYPLESDLNSRTKMLFFMVKKIKFFLDQAGYASNPNVTDAPESSLGAANPWGSTKNLISANIFHKDKNDWLKEMGGQISTPFIWDYTDSKWIFASGVTNSMLERNMAQAIALVTDFNWDSLETTASIKKLQVVSDYASKIEPPVWNQEILGKINTEFAEEGKQIFKQECLHCHSTSKPNGIASIEYNYMDVGTDTEYIKAQQESFYGKDFFSEVLAPWMKDVKISAAKREGISDLSKYESGREFVFWRKPDRVRYAAKPLYGVWATAPYLHNASVLNMSELLKPAKDRLKSFYVGSFEYDSLNLGFTNEQRWYSSKFEVDCKSCRGNSNVGHEFGVNLTSHQKLALIEFLKSYTKDTVFE